MSVNISLANGQLGGTLQTSDGICGMVLTGNTEGDYTVGTPILITGMSDLANSGITNNDNPFAYRQVKEFYDVAGEGAQLYLMLVADSLNVDDMADNTNANGAKKLLNFANGKIRVLGIMTDDWAINDDYEITISDGLNEKVYTAVPNMDTMAAAYFAQEWPFRCIIGGTSYTGVPADLVDMTDGTTYNRSAILIGDTEIWHGDSDEGYNAAALGLCLGRIASIPVQRKISRVRDGALPVVQAYLGTAAYETTGGDAATIAGKGYITWATYPNVSGYYFSGDHMTTANTDDYEFLARGRVIDKAHTIAYATFVQEVDDEVPIANDGSGNIDAGFAKWLQQQIINALNVSMVAQKNISGCDCYIDTNQDILATSTLNVVLKVRPVGYSTTIDVVLGFEQ